MGLDVQIQVDGQAIDFSRYLYKLVVQDNDDLTIDTAKLQLYNDHNELLLPQHQEQIKIAIKGVDFGTFAVNQSLDDSQGFHHIKARGGDFGASLTDKKNRSFHQQTLNQIIQQIAIDNGLTMAIDPRLANEVKQHIIQRDESDLNLLTRLSLEYGAIVKINSGILLFSYNNGVTTSGEAMPVYQHTLQTDDIFQSSFDKRTLKQQFILRTTGNPLYRAGSVINIKGQNYILNLAKHVLIHGRGYWTIIKGTSQ